MKTRRTKFLLSFLAIAILGFAMANAYTFEVTNRDPFGTLNLSTLMIKPSAGNNNETMLLSGTTLRIKTDQGKLKVHKICNEKAGAEESCLAFDEIGNGGGGSGITATGTIEDYCYLLSDGNLRCDDDTLMSKIAAIEAFMNSYTPGEGATVTATGENTGFYCSSTNGRELVCNNKITSVPGEGVTVSVTGTTTGYYCSSTGDGKTLVCNNPITGGSGITVDSGRTGFYCKLNDNGNLDCDGNSSNWGGGGDSEWIKDPIAQIGTDTTMDILHPKDYRYNVWIGVNAETLKAGGAKNYKLRVANGKTQIDGDVEIKPNESVPANFDGRGVRFFNAMALLMTRYTAEFEDDGITIKSKIPVGTVTGFTVNGPIAAGNPSNYIYMYADGNSGDADRHYEIMGNNELAIGTQYGAFLYFTQKTGNYLYHIEPMMYGNATTYGGGGEGCEAPKPDTPETPGVISPKSSCSATNSVQTTMAHPLQPGDYIDAYKTFMVGVNTNEPNATLDVYGSLRIGNNCVPAICDTGHAGTIMYYETADGGHMVICSLGIDSTLTNRGYHRYEINKTFYDNNGEPRGYNRECYAPTPSPHPVPHPEPYVISEGVGTPFGGASDS